MEIIALELTALKPADAAEFGFLLGMEIIALELTALKLELEIAEKWTQVMEIIALELTALKLNECLPRLFGEKDGDHSAGAHRTETGQSVQTSPV